MRTKIKLIVFLTVLINPLLFSQNTLNFAYDFALFRDEGSKVYMELYYGFNPHELAFVKSSSGYEASGKFTLDIINKASGKTVAMKEYRVPVTLADTSGKNKDFQLTGQLNILLDSGTYLIKISAGDVNDASKTFALEDEIHLKAFETGKAAMSTIELSTGINKSSDENNIFYKNTLEVTPNPSGLYGKNLSKLYYYLELYGLNQAELGNNFTIVTTLANSDGSEIKNTQKTYDTKTESKVEYGTVDITELPSNKYLFLVKLLNSESKELMRAFKIFYVYSGDSVNSNQTLTDLENEYLLSEYAKMSEKDVDNEFKKAIYLMSDSQKDKYESLKSVDEKRMFMFKYWKGISAYLTKKDYFARIDFANKNYKDDLRDGWKTDRGRIYSIYGKYDEIERFPYEGSTRAYEIWTYNKLQGGIIFVFVDKSSGYGDFVLVHSTAQNEIFDDNWKEKINIK